MIPFIEAVKKQYPGVIVLVKFDTYLCAYENDADMLHLVFNSPIENHQLGKRARIELSQKPLLQLRNINVGYAVYDNGAVTSVYRAKPKVSASQSQSSVSKAPLRSSQSASSKTSISVQKNRNTGRFDSSVLSSGYKNKSRLDRLQELQRHFPNTLILFKNSGAYYGFDETAVAMDMLFKTGYSFGSGHRVACFFNITMMENEFVKRGLRYLVDEDGVTTFHNGKGFALANSLSSYPMSSKAKNLSQSKSKPKIQSYNGPYERSGYGWNDDTWTPGLPSSRFYRKRKH